MLLQGDLIRTSTQVHQVQGACSGDTVSMLASLIRYVQVQFIIMDIFHAFKPDPRSSYNPNICNQDCKQGRQPT